MNAYSRYTDGRAASEATTNRANFNTTMTELIAASDQQIHLPGSLHWWFDEIAPGTMTPPILAESEESWDEEDFQSLFREFSAGLSDVESPPRPSARRRLYTGPPPIDPPAEHVELNQ